jgi:hypothetical protein
MSCRPIVVSNGRRLPPVASNCLRGMNSVFSLMYIRHDSEKLIWFRDMSAFASITMSSAGPLQGTMRTTGSGPAQDAVSNAVEQFVRGGGKVHLNNTVLHATATV